MAKTNYLEDAVIQFFLRNDADTFTPPTTVFVALFTAVADDEVGTVTEVAGGNGYARVSCAFDDPAGVGVTQNTSEVAFGEATGANGTATHFGLSDAATVGNFMYIAPLDAPFDYDTGVLPRFAAGAIEVTEE